MHWALTACMFMHSVLHCMAALHGCFGRLNCMAALHGCIAEHVLQALHHNVYAVVSAVCPSTTLAFAHLNNHGEAALLLLQTLAAAATFAVPGCSAAGLKNLLWALGQSQYLEPELMQAIEAQLASQSSHLRSGFVVSALWVKLQTLMECFLQHVTFL